MQASVASSPPAMASAPPVAGQSNPGRPLVTPERGIGAMSAEEPSDGDAGRVDQIAGGSGSGNAAGDGRGTATGSDAGGDTVSTVAQQLRLLRRIVDVDHPRRFQKIETDLRWVIMLTSAQLVAIVGGAIAVFALN